MLTSTTLKVKDIIFEKWKLSWDIMKYITEKWNCRYCHDIHEMLMKQVWPCNCIFMKWSRFLVWSGLILSSWAEQQGGVHGGLWLWSTVVMRIMVLDVAVLLVPCICNLTRNANWLSVINFTVHGLENRLIANGHRYMQRGLIAKRRG